MSVRKTDVFVVVGFTYPEGDNPGEYDGVVGVYPTMEEAEEVQSRHELSQVSEAYLYGDLTLGPR